MMSLNRRSTSMIAAALAAVFAAAPAFAQDDQAIESIVKAKPHPQVFWKPLVDASAEAWTSFADATHLNRPSATCKHHSQSATQCLHWSVSARYTATQDQTTNALSERVDGDVQVQMNQPHFLLFFKRPF